jgi:hypothetical protein
VQRSGEYGEVIKIGRAGVSDTAGISYPADGTFQITTAATPRMTINASGNVGIGTTNPQDRLHIVGQQRLQSSAVPTSNHNLIYHNATALVDYGLRIEHINNAVNDAAIQIGGADTVGTITFQTNTAGNAATSRMAITAAGNVGIGTQSPAAKLHVKSTGEIQRLETTTARGGGSNYLSYYDPTGVSAYLGFSGANDAFNIYNVLNGNMSFFTNSINRVIIQAGGNTIPAANNSYELGSSSFRWSTIYAQNALNTSDARLKTDIAESSLGLDFIAALNPVQFRYIEGGNTVERVQTGTETVEITPAIPAQPEVLNEEGNVIQEATEEVPAITEERPTFETVVTPREGVRTHFGLLAQEVKAALPDELDFAGWALADKEDAESTQFLGYAELIAPMIKAIQELNAKVEALEAQISK